MADRIQRSRRKGSKLPAGCVCVTRPGRFGNPFAPTSAPPVLMVIGHDGAGRPVHGVRPQTRQQSVDLYRRWLADTAEGRAIAAAARRELAGKSLACWCPLPVNGEPDVCHAAVLLEVCRG